MLELLPGVKEI